MRLRCNHFSCLYKYSITRTKMKSSSFKITKNMPRKLNICQINLKLRCRLASITNLHEVWLISNVTIPCKTSTNWCTIFCAHINNIHRIVAFFIATWFISANRNNDDKGMTSYLHGARFLYIYEFLQCIQHTDTKYISIGFFFIRKVRGFGCLPSFLRIKLSSLLLIFFWTFLNTAWIALLLF